MGRQPGRAVPGQAAEGATDGSATRPLEPSIKHVVASTGAIESLIRLEESEAPIYLQLADQLRYLIKAGELPTGSRLPTARHLAQNLKINRNTVMNAYSALARDGYVRGNRRGGTRVIGTGADAPRQEPVDRRLLEIADQLVVTAQELGMAPASLGSFVEARAQLIRSQASLRVCFVECNSASLGYFVGELDREFGLATMPILLEDLGTRDDFDLSGVDCVVSTFYHLSEVRRSLRRAGASTELFAIAVRPHLSVVEALERLPMGSEVGVAYAGAGEAGIPIEERLRRMTEAVQQTKVRGLRVRPIMVGDETDPAVFAGLAAIVVRPENIAAVRSVIPADVAVIEFVRVLDGASKSFLREVFADLALRSQEGRPSPMVDRG